MKIILPDGSVQEAEDELRAIDLSSSAPVYQTGGIFSTATRQDKHGRFPATVRFVDVHIDFVHCIQYLSILLCYHKNCRCGKKIFSRFRALTFSVLNTKLREQMQADGAAPGSPVRRKNPYNMEGTDDESDT